MCGIDTVIDFALQITMIFMALAVEESDEMKMFCLFERKMTLSLFFYCLDFILIDHDVINIYDTHKLCVKYYSFTEFFMKG